MALLPKLLMEDEFNKQVKFCEIIMDKKNRYSIFIKKKYFFSDESTFVLNGHVNRQTSQYWATENPHSMQKYHTQYLEKINVWVGIINN